MNESYYYNYNPSSRAKINRPAGRPAYQTQARQRAGAYPAHRARPAKRRSMASVYIARYILLLAIYFVLMVVSALGMAMLLHFGFGGELFVKTEPVTVAAAAPPAKASEGVGYEEYVEASISNLTFKLDLSEYEEYMNPSDRDAYIKLINQTHTIEKDFKPDDLVNAPYVRDGVVTPYLRLYAAKALEAMLSEAYANGCSQTLTVTSAYRSYDYQQFLYDYRVSVYSYLGEEEARKKAATIVAIPGQSEHQTGLAADIHTLLSADEVFENTYEFQWLKENSWKFGFILRYPKDKTHITGIIYEPWHFRYVGRYHAFKIYESGLTLEEYCELTGLGLD